MPKSGGLIKPNTIQKNKLLIVEGNHERDFFESWLQALGKTDIQVMPIGGKTQLRDNLSSLVKQRAFLDGQISSLVVIRDADDNPAGAFESVRDAFRDVGLAVPSRCMEMTTESPPSVAIVILPTADSHGALEELLIETVMDDPAAPLAIAFLNKVIEVLQISGQRAHTPSHKLGKARVHAFLATLIDPDKDAGKAALGGVWNFSHSALLPLLQVLQNM